MNQYRPTRGSSAHSRAIVVTGAAGGQGKAEACALAEAGHIVYAVDLAPEATYVLPRGVQYRRLDVADPVGWSELAQEINSNHGSVHGLVNNAGISWRARLGEVELQDLRRVMDINANGPLLGIQALSPLMPPGSSIVNIGSVAAVTGHYSVAYTMSKWALRGLTKTASLALGAEGIRVNLVNPGFVETPMTEAAPSQFRDASLAEIPAGRTGLPEDIAPLIVFLMSEASSYITGAEIPVDGGMTAHGGMKSISEAMISRTG